jgi:hypothetical protein
MKIRFKKPSQKIGYSQAEMDTFGEWRLWQEFGLHRGVIDEGRYYYIGLGGEVGALSGQFRMVFAAAGVISKAMDSHAPLQGPVLGGNTDNDVETTFKRYVAPVKLYLNSKHVPKPRINLRNRPGIIAYADRPDVGGKPTIRIRQ